jgi:4'-phosphopantetheinyl transferase
MFEADKGWPSPPAALNLAENEIHVWRVRLGLPKHVISRLWPILSADERSKAERFRFPRDRAHYIVARGSLRGILSRYLLLEPQQLRFIYSSYGKPALDPAFHSKILHFNLSHARGLALYAIASGGQVGIDIEDLRTDFPWAEVAERFFSSQEHRALHALPADMRYQAFFNCWTRKEAYLKARGDGLVHPLDRFSVSLRPGEPAELLYSEIPGEVARWSLLELWPGPGYVAAMAVEGHNWHVICWQWNARGL